jgi:hypothetical protein
MTGGQGRQVDRDGVDIVGAREQYQPSLVAEALGGCLYPGSQVAVGHLFGTRDDGNPVAMGCEATGEGYGCEVGPDVEEWSHARILR